MRSAARSPLSGTPEKSTRGSQFLSAMAVLACKAAHAIFGKYAYGMSAVWTWVGAGSRTGKWDCSRRPTGAQIGYHRRFMRGARPGHRRCFDGISSFAGILRGAEWTRRGTDDT